MIWALVLLAAPSVEACLDASEAAQVDVREGRVLAARAGFETCADAACPAVVRRDCASRLDTIRVPSIELAVVDDAGVPIPNARVTIDGAPRTVGRIELDPGTHTLSVVTGALRHDAELIVAEADRERAVRVVLARPEPEPPIAITAPPPSNTRSIALTAVSGAALATFAIVGALAGR